MRAKILIALSLFAVLPTASGQTYRPYGNFHHPRMAVMPQREIHAFKVVDLIDATLYSSDDSKIGQIDKVLVGPARQVFVAVKKPNAGKAPFLIPVENLIVRGKHIAIFGMGSEDLDDLPEWNKQNKGYSAANANDRVRLECAEGCSLGQGSATAGQHTSD